MVLDNRVYTPDCEAVLPTAVGDVVLGTGPGLFREARAIEGLPQQWWLAARGDGMCEGIGAPNAYYLMTYWDIPRGKLVEYGPQISAVIASD